MKVSAKTRYAARILLALANAQEKTSFSSINPSTQDSAEDQAIPEDQAVPEDQASAEDQANEVSSAQVDGAWTPPPPLSSHVLAEKTGVTVQFTEQILKSLKRGGLTTSTRGAAGGHSLMRDPEHISLGEVVQIMEGGVQLASCVSARGTCDEVTCSKIACERADVCAMRTAWSYVTRALEDTLAGISLADLVKTKTPL